MRHLLTKSLRHLPVVIEHVDRLHTFFFLIRKQIKHIIRCIELFEDERKNKSVQITANEFARSSLPDDEFAND